MELELRQEVQLQRGLKAVEVTGGPLKISPTAGGLPISLVWFKQMAS